LSPSQARDILFFKTPKLAVDPTSLLFSGYRSIFLGQEVKRPEQKVDHLLLSTLRLSDWSYVFFPPFILLDVDEDNIANNR